MAEIKLGSFSHIDIQQAVQNKRLIILSPRLHLHNILLANFIQGPNTYLYQLFPTDTDVVTFVRNISSDLANRTMENTQQSVTDLAQALALAITKSGFTTVILDEIDRLEATVQTFEFFEHLVSSLPSSVQLVLNGRNLSYQLYNRMVQAGVAIILGDERMRKNGQNIIEVNALGTGSVYVNGLPVNKWDGPLPENLFYYLIDHPLVTRDEIFEMFWPDLNIKEATNVFHVTKRKISERLGCEITAYSGGFYRPAPDIDLQYDVAQFENACSIARAESTSLSDWNLAVHLYRVEFLHNHTMPWVRERREVLREMYADALINLARLHVGKEEVEMAVHYFMRALRELPLREDVYRAVMTIYQQQGEQQKAQELYDTLVSTLEHRLKIKPSAITTAHYRQAVGMLP